MSIEVLTRPNGDKWVRVTYENGDVLKFVLPDTTSPEVTIQLIGDGGGNQLAIAPYACNNIKILKV